jgi:translation elongation factor EF-G
VLRQVPIRDGEEVTGFVDLVSERAYKYKEGNPSELIEMPDSIKAREAEARQEMLEALADFDDSLLEELLEDRALGEATRGSGSPAPQQLTGSGREEGRWWRPLDVGS